MNVEGRIIRYYSEQDRLAIHGTGKDECYEIRLHPFLQHIANWNSLTAEEYCEFADKLKEGKLEDEHITIKFSKKDWVKDYDVTGVTEITMGTKTWKRKRPNE